MKYEIGFGVGFTANGTPIDQTNKTEWLKIAMVEACRRFGGCNITFGQGAWLNPRGDLIMEESAVMVVSSLPTGRMAEDHHREALELAEFVRKIFQQEAVVFTQLVSTTEVMYARQMDVIDGRG